MKFHEHSEYTDVLQERVTTELTWENYINNRKKNINPTKEDIIKLLDQLEDYICCNFPYRSRGLDPNDKNIQEIMSAFDNICRIAAMMAECVDEENLQIDYFNEKFTCILRFLALEKIND